MKGNNTVLIVKHFIERRPDKLTSAGYTRRRLARFSDKDVYLIQWRIQTFGMGATSCLRIRTFRYEIAEYAYYMFPKPHVYFFVGGGGQSLKPNWKGNHGGIFPHPCIRHWPYNHSERLLPRCPVSKAPSQPTVLLWPSAGKQGLRWSPK